MLKDTGKVVDPDSLQAIRDAQALMPIVAAMNRLLNFALNQIAINFKERNGLDHAKEYQVVPETGQVLEVVKESFGVKSDAKGNFSIH